MSLASDHKPRSPRGNREARISNIKANGGCVRNLITLGRCTVDAQILAFFSGPFSFSG